MLHDLIEQHADESCCNSGPQDQSAKLGIWHRGRLMAVAPTFVTEVGQHLRRDNHHERQDWLSRTKATMAVPARPSPSHCSLADPVCVLTHGSYSPFPPRLTEEPPNGIGEEQHHYGAERDRGNDEPRLS